MGTRMRWAILVTTLFCAGSALAQHPPGSERVDMQLVLAIDGSTSIDGGLFEFQLQGHAAAFRDPKLVEAITAGSGGIAVTVALWSDPATFRILVPWTVVSDRSSATGLAAAIDAVPRRPLQGSTGIGAALLNAADLFQRGGNAAPHRVIDIVSNGYNNIGIAPQAARERVVAQGITINGLVILDEVPWLAEYFATQVIGGPSAFVTVADTPDAFRRAILDKLVQEITDNGNAGNRPASVRTAEGVQR